MNQGSHVSGRSHLNSLQPLTTSTFGHEVVYNKLEQVETLVADALSSSNGECAPAATRAVEGAVARAKTKGKILPLMGSSLVIAALDEVAWEVASFPEASVANAALMRQMTEGMQQGPSQSATTATAAQRVPDSSVVTQWGDPVDLSSLTVDENASSSVSGRSEQRIDKNEHGAPSSYLTTIRGERESSPASSASEKGDAGGEDDTKSTAASGATENTNLLLPRPISSSSSPSLTMKDTPSTADTMLATAKSILQPLCQKLAIEACAAEEQVHREFGSSVGLTLKKPTHEEMCAARDVDFDTCASPRTHNTTPYGSPRVRGACLEYGLDTSGRARKVEPVDPSVHQFSPMSPTVAIAQVISGGVGKILTLKGNPIGHLHQRHGHDQQQHHNQHQNNARNAFSAPVSPVSAGGRVASVCESGVPPGLLPTARVEGVRRSLDGDGGGGGAVPVEFVGGALDGDDGGSPSGDEIGELGSQFQGGLRV